VHYKGLDLNLLVVLDALLAEKNITRTGERIHLSQSATSGALARLRDFFNDDLLAQIGNKMVLTPLAESLAQPIREILQQVEVVINKGPGFSAETSTRKFRLMMSDYAASVLMPNALPRIQELAPRITFELLSNAENPAEILERGDVDLLIIPPEYASKLHPSEELFQDRYVCLVWRENPEFTDHISLQQYRDSGHVGVRLGKQQMHVFDERFLERERFERRIEVVCMTFDLVPRLVVGTTRVATVPERLARGYATQFPLKLLVTPIDIPPLHEVAQWHRYQQTDTGVAWLRNIFSDVAHTI
jgi:LysR family nod box-dependent transcriptional activator